jgi:hypothetical protein
MSEVDDPRTWPRVNENDQTTLAELQRGDYVPGLGLVQSIDHDAHTISFEARNYKLTAEHWGWLAYEGVRRRFLVIEEEPW